MLLFCSIFIWSLQEVRSQASRPWLGFQCWDSWVLCFYNAGFWTGSSYGLRLSQWWNGGCTSISYSRFVINSYGLLICLFSLLETMNISGGVEGTEVTASSFLTVSAAFLSFEDAYCHQVQWWIADTAPSFLSPCQEMMPWSQHSCLLWSG